MASRMIQNNFSGGEISPSLFGRSDLQAYYKGAAEIENFVVSKEGTLRKRHGITSFMELPEDHSRCKIIPYKYDRSEGGFFILYAPSDAPTVCRVELYTKAGEKRSWEVDGGTVDHIDITGFQGTVRAFQHKQIGDEIWISNEKTFRTLKVMTTSESDPMSTATFSISEWEQAPIPDNIPYNAASGLTSSRWKLSASASSNDRQIYYGVICVKDSVNSETSKQNIGFTQTWQAGSYIDVSVIITAADREKWDYILIAKRTGGNYGELSRVYMTDDPDEAHNAENVQVYKGPDAKWFTSQNAYKWSDGRYYDKAEDDPQAGSAVELFEQTIAYYTWQFRDENHTPSDMIYGQTDILGAGWTTPLCVDCFQQRRVFANSSNDSGKFPMTLWFSETGNLNNFYADRPSAEDDPFSPTIAASGPAFILWVVAYQEMMVLFTESGLFSVGFSQQQGFSASSCRISKFSDLAASPDIQPVVTEAGIVFVGADNKTCYSVAYDLQENMLKPINRSVLTEHLTRTASITGIGLQDYPDNIIWVSTSDGKVCSFTIEKNENVFSWSHSRISGASILEVVGTGTCTDSDEDRTYGDLLFAVEKTTVDGNGVETTRQYLCRQNDGYRDSIGGVETNVAAFVVTLRPESQEKTIVGYKKNIKDVLIRVYRTGGLAVRSPDGGDIPLVAARIPGNLHTGDVKVMPRGVVNEDGQLVIVSDNDDPCELLQIVTNVEIE